MQSAARLDNAGLPSHIAIIMDGNGRWANARGRPRVFGHKRGVEAVRRTIEAAKELGIGYLTLYAFSSENWKRPVDEVSELMRLLRFYLQSEVAELHRAGVRIRMVGERGRLANDIVDLIDHAERLTESNTVLTLCIALNYGGRQEIARAAREIAAAAQRGEIDADSIDENMLAARLYTSDIPDPDLIIRTSGEKRISNFLLWQAAYAEFLFLDTLWPDFGRADLELAISEFQRRDRRFGAVGGR